MLPLSSPGWINLSQQQWFQEILCKWDRADKQHDAAEFTSHMVECMGMPGLTVPWERRVLTSIGLETADKSCGFQPLTLQFPADCNIRAHFTLKELIASWHQQLGMCTALNSQPDLVCLHLDRFSCDDSGTIIKLPNTVGFWPGCMLPVFDGPDQLDIQMVSYHTVAVVAHLGTDRSGHYQAMLRCQFHDDFVQPPAAWLITDDNKTVDITYQFPDWFYGNATLIWLCRSDRAKLSDIIPRLRNRLMDDLMPSPSLLDLLAASPHN